MTRLLVVDDEPDIAAVLKQGLEKHGFEVDSFTDPQRALDNFKQNYYSMAIVDIQMPKLTGFQLYRELKKKDETIKVAFITAFDIYENEFTKVFKNTKVNLFFKKPISIMRMIESIKQELGLAHDY